MSREMVIVQWCDGDHHEQTPASTAHTLAIGSSRPVQLDLCDEHEGVIKELADLLDRGTPVQQLAKAPAEPKEKRPYRRRNDHSGQQSRPCPLCGTRSTTETGLRQHFATKHPGEGTLLEWEARHAQPELGASTP